MTHLSMHASGINHYHSSDGTKVVLTNVGMDKIFGPDFKDGAVKAAKNK